MKKAIVTLLLLFATVGVQFVANAEDVDQETARRVGVYYWSQKVGKIWGDMTQVKLAKTIMNEEKGVPAIYIFNLGEDGYVIVTGSTSAEPIVSYSYESALDVDNMPPSMNWWLNGWAAAVSQAQNEGTEASMEIEKKWDNLLNHSIPMTANGTKARKFLLKDFWSQDDPFNGMCPYEIQNGQTVHCAVGCVALAMSQIVHYWRYPYTGKGSKWWSYNNTQNGSINFAQQTYRYDLMRDTLNSSWTQENKDAAAQLCFHMGVLSNMSWGIDASGSYVNQANIVTPLKTYFKYPAAQYKSREDMTTKQFVSLVKSEIEKRYPVMFGAYDNASTDVDAGHAFVCDGVDPDDTNMFHFNWGWGGPRYTANGWNNLATPALNAAGYHFNDNHRVIVNFVPPSDSNWVLSIPKVADVTTYPAYPNPAISEVHIPYDLTGNQSAMLTIYNIEGRQMEQYVMTPGETEVVVNVSKYPHGVYVYRVNGKTHKFTVR